ncbi:MBL fold metallo-hydrolase [Aneurinibacillus terranovensis]|uniref:MBL fold metallo-hydrolase n=1 Tax=Aneurinibacillus terranovensis TaxID=278991 RepID=UPI0004106CD1|nr:MBL fold metallo-hydrolase [Aneurinibacillus terranovensis]
MESVLKKYGLYQVTVPLPFRLNHVHCYLAREGEGWQIIDAGLNESKTKEAWAKAFIDYQIKSANVKNIVLTHYHPDHFGFAGSLQEWTGATVQMSQSGQVHAFSVWTEDNLAKNRRLYRKAGFPESMIDALSADDHSFYNRVRPFPSINGEIAEGQWYRIGELDFQAIHTPGHADGHMCFYNHEEKVLIAGDHLLKKITPNVSCHGYGDENPLAAYLQSLKKIQGLQIKLVLPGHGPIFTDAAERINELLQHHEERLAFVLESIKGEMTAWEVSNALFTRVLSVHEQRFAIGETLSHLNYLVAEGKIARSNVDGEDPVLYRVL